MFNQLKSVNYINKLHHFAYKRSNYFLSCAQVQIRSYHGAPEEDTQYLQHSIIPTMHFQDSLPRLPIPELSMTCERYITALKPITSEEKLQKTFQIVEKFKNNEGKELQEELQAINARNKHTSYISGPWFDMYLKSRLPLVLNYNPFMAFKDDPKKEYNNQLIRATNMLLSSLRFMKSLRANVLEPEIFHLNPAKSDTQFFRKAMRWVPGSLAWYGAYLFKAFPLDMSQFNNLFNSTRIPHLEKDEIQVFPEARHLVVLRNGYFYIFDVLDGDGNILPPAHIYNHMNYILSDARTPPSHPISLLTTEDRDTWAEARDHLEKLGNAEQLRLIDSAIFVLALDDQYLGDDLVTSAHHMLHGPAYNRWFDKSFTLMISKDGKAAINFEHAWGDGVAVLRYFNEVFTDSTKNHFVGPKTVSANIDPSHRVRRLDFILDETIKSAVRKAQDRLNQATDSLQLSILQYDRMHRDSIKNYKLSPDSVAQLGFQMAYYKIYGTSVATYESCSTSAFKHGRTETVRPATMATKKFIEEFHKNNQISNSELRALLAECTKTHNQLTKEAAMGQGFDRPNVLSNSVRSGVLPFQEIISLLPDIFKMDNSELPITDAQKKILQKFKANIADIITPHHTDAILVKWLKARNFNLKKAEANFREVDSNRKLFGVNTILDTYVMPEVGVKYGATGFLGFAKDGTPVRYYGVGTADFYGFLQSMCGYQTCLYFSYLMEYDINQMREENARTGRQLNEITFVADMEGFSLHQVTHKCVIEMILDFSRMVQDHYPEIWRNIFIVNAPSYFDRIFNVVKPIMRANMLDRMHVAPKSSVSQLLLKYIDEDVLPAFLGGKKVGANGDPRCADIIGQGGKISEEFYIRNRIPPLMPSSVDGTKEVVIGPRSAFNCSFVLKEKGTRFKIKFRTENGQIHFSVLFREVGPDPDNPDMPPSDEYLDENDEKSRVKLASAHFRVQSHLAECHGQALIHVPGIYILRFNNTQSWFTSRKLIYHVEIFPPES